MLKNNVRFFEGGFRQVQKSILSDELVQKLYQKAIVQPYRLDRGPLNKTKKTEKRKRNKKKKKKKKKKEKEKEKKKKKKKKKKKEKRKEKKT